MSASVSAGVLQALDLAVFQRDDRGRLRLTSRAPAWLRALWPQAASRRGALEPATAPFLENFLVDAAACWQAGGDSQAASGPWVERDARGVEHRLRAKAFTLAGRATLLIAEPGAAEDEQALLLQKARELALAHERLQVAEQALAAEKRLVDQRVRERTAELMQTNAMLSREMALRQRLVERLQGEHDLIEGILVARSVETIAAAALQRLRHLWSYDQAVLLELDSERRLAIVLASARDGQVTYHSGWVLSPEQLKKCHALQSGCLRQTRRHRNLFADPAGGAAELEKVWSLIVDAPLVVEETLIGVLNLASERQAQLQPEDEEIVREAASRLAVAMREARLFAEVVKARERLRALSLRLVELQESERRSLAHELHDEIGQLLTGLKLSLEMFGRATPPGPRATLDEAIETVDDLMRQVRRLSLDLRPQILDDLGLLPALEWLFLRCFKQTGLRVRFKHRDIAGRFPTQLETAVFRIVQEALTNVVRHARIDEATVRLWLNSDARTLAVQVQDAGAGFDLPRVLAARASSGLVGMRERAELLEGQFTLDSAPGAGTRLTVELPLRPAAPEPPASTDRST